MISPRVGFACLTLGLCILPASAQLRRPLACTEDASVELDAPGASEGARARVRRAKTFSLVSSGGFVTMISAGRSDYYECQLALPRSNERTPRNAIKCQNGVYFLLLDLAKQNYVEAQLNPEDRGEVWVSYGSCKAL